MELLCERATASDKATDLLPLPGRSNNLLMSSQYARSRRGCIGFCTIPGFRP